LYEGTRIERKPNEIHCLPANLHLANERYGVYHNIASRVLIRYKFLEKKLEDEEQLSRFKIASVRINTFNTIR